MQQGGNIQPYQGIHPRIHPTAWVHDSAVVIGDVELGPHVSVWPGCVLRGDQGSITVGAESNIQDGTIIHATRGLSSTVVGARVTVGHRVVLHGCRIEDDCLVGMGAVVLDNARVGRFSLVGACALVPLGREIPERSLVIGMPATVKRQLSEAEIDEHIRHAHGEYTRLKDEYLQAEQGDPR